MDEEINKIGIVEEYDSDVHNFKILKDRNVVITEIFTENPKRVVLSEDEMHVLTIKYETLISKSNFRKALKNKKK